MIIETWACEDIVSWYYIRSLKREEKSYSWWLVAGSSCFLGYHVQDGQGLSRRHGSETVTILVAINSKAWI